MPESRAFWMRSLRFTGVWLSLARSPRCAWGFLKHLRGTHFPPWVIGRNSMTAWETDIVGVEWARKWSQWCATTRTPETPAPQYADVPLEGWGPHTRSRPTVIRGAGPERPWDAATREWLQAAREPHTGWRGNVSSLLRALLHPSLVLHTAKILRAAEIHTLVCGAATVRWFSSEEGGTRLTAAHFKKGKRTYDDPRPGWATFQDPCSTCSPPTPLPRCAGSWTAAMG